MQTWIGILVLGVAAPALAAGGDEASDSTFFFYLLNFVLLMAALVYFARKPAIDYFNQRRSDIRADLDQAAQLKAEAEERHSKWQRRLVDLEQELEGIRATSRERAESERDQILAEARTSAERIQRDASAAIEQETRRARERLHDEASTLAVELASGILKQQVGDTDRDRLLDEFIERIEQAPASGPGGGN